MSDFEILSELPVLLSVLILKDRFANFKSPLKKIHDLVQKEYLLPLRRGLYLNMKSAKWNLTPLEVLANSLLFPSYVSAEWALQFHGLIPERVHTVTSVTPLRPQTFDIPPGIFAFEHLKKGRYPCGYFERKSGDVGFWIARPEKALVDFIDLRVGKVSWKSPRDIDEFLRDDLRLDVDRFLQIVPVEDLQELLPYYHRNSNEARVLKWLLARKEKDGESH